MRRKERELTVDQAWEVVEGTDHAVLATVDDEGNPYGVPITPVAADRKRIYFHATGKPGGRKSDNMKMNRRVSLTYIGKELTVPELYTVDYASAIVEGTASIVTDPAERAEAMVAMVRRHAPGNSDARNAIQFTNRLGRSRYGGLMWFRFPAKPVPRPNGKPERHYRNLRRCLCSRGLSALQSRSEIF